MRFTNFEKSYQVLQRLDSTDQTEEFVCTEENERGKALWLLVRVQDPVLAKRLTLFLEERIKGREFTDYRECFREDGALLIVFLYSRNESLKDLLSTGKCGLRERAEIAKNILEYLLLLNPHTYFAWNGLDSSRITVSRSLDVHMNYHLEAFEKIDNISLTDVSRKLQDVFLSLFGEEIRKQLYPALNDYIRRLGAVGEQSYLQLYQDYMSVYGLLIQKEAQEQLPRTFWFRLWEKTKKILGLCKKILAVVIIVAAVFYVINSLQKSRSSQSAVQTINQIGDLNIQDYGVSQQENGE